MLTGSITSILKTAASPPTTRCLSLKLCSASTIKQSTKGWKGTPAITTGLTPNQHFWKIRLLMLIGCTHCKQATLSSQKSHKALSYMTKFLKNCCRSWRGITSLKRIWTLKIIRTTGLRLLLGCCWSTISRGVTSSKIARIGAKLWGTSIEFQLCSCTSKPTKSYL